MAADDDDIGGQRTGGDPVTDAIAALRQMASSGAATRTLGALVSLLGKPGAQRDAGDADTSEVEDAVGFIGQACLIAAASGLRYWQRVLETSGEHQLDIVRAIGGGTQPELAEGLRAYARKLGDVSLQEARLYQAELDRLAMSLNPPDEAGDYQRRWRVKP